MEKKNLWIMVGYPGSGKTYFAKHNLMIGPGWRYISRDEIRFSLLKDGEKYFSHEKEVYNNFISKIRSALNEEGIFNVIADATHLNQNSRQKLLHNIKNIYKNFDNLNLIPVVIICDIPTAIKRNEKRSGYERVDSNVIKKMASQLTDPKDDSIEYNSIMYVENGTKITTIEKPRFMYKKNEPKIKEYSICNVIKKEDIYK